MLESLTVLYTVNASKVFDPAMSRLLHFL